MIEKTLIIVKHDGVIRGLIGEIIRRFENMGLKIVGMKMIWANEKLAENHYRLTDEWVKSVGEKTKKSYEEKGIKLKESNLDIAKRIQRWSKDYLMEGPTVAIVFEGPHAVELGRKLIGHTEPRRASPGTIRGDYSFESIELADTKKRPTRNLVHASESVKEAEREINLWFNKEELHSY